MLEIVTSLSSVIIEDVWTCRTGRSKAVLGTNQSRKAPCVVTFGVSKNRHNPGQAGVQILTSPSH